MTGRHPFHLVIGKINSPGTSYPPRQRTRFKGSTRLVICLDYSRTINLFQIPCSDASILSQRGRNNRAGTDLRRDIITPSAHAAHFLLDSNKL